MNASRTGIDQDAAGFLVDASDARMMGRLEGKLAAQRGTTTAVRAYGAKMVHDQSMLLNQIRQLAKSQHIALAAQISNEKKDGLKELGEKQGGDFDKKFIKMMTIDHERDVKKFDKASSLSNTAVSKFAAEHLPLIREHLAEVRELK